MEILVFSHSFNKKLLNIVISDPVSINSHVYNLVSRILTIIDTIDQALHHGALRFCCEKE